MTGGGGLTPQGLDELLDQTSKLLQSVRTTQAAGDDAERTGTGEAADGRVQATVGRDGKLTALHLDPRAMRLDSETLAEQVMQAVNAAITSLRESDAPTDVAVPQVDTAELSNRLDELRSDSVRSMAAFTQAMDDVVARLSRGPNT